MNIGVNDEFVVPIRYRYMMAKGKHLSGNKKRESRTRQSSLNSATQNGSLESSVLTDNPRASSYTNQGIDIKISKSDNVTETIEDSFNHKLSKVSPTTNLKTTNYDACCMPNNKMAGFPHQDMNANITMPVPQYYFLTQLMNQQKKVLEPDSINIKRNETSTSNNITCSTTNISPSTVLSSRSVTKKGSKVEASSSDHDNNNVPIIDDSKCQCHVMLDPYPSNLSLR